MKMFDSLSLIGPKFLVTAAAKQIKAKIERPLQAFLFRGFIDGRVGVRNRWTINLPLSGKPDPRHTAAVARWTALNTDTRSTDDTI